MTDTTAQHAGIDVGAEELVLVVRKNGISMKAQRFANTPASCARLATKLAKMADLTVCLEATGVYSLDLAIALHDAGVRLNVVNPKAAHNFAKALMKHSKTDAIDADTLAQYAERMPFTAWARPSSQALAVRVFARRINTLTRQKAMAKNHLHALSFGPDLPPAIVRDAQAAVAELEKRIATLSRETRAFIEQHPQLQRSFQLLRSIKGVGETSAMALLGELLLLPQGLSHRQWVKYAGLDPRGFQSGKSIDKQPRLSKAGNRHIRHALYMPALSAKRHDPYVRGYFQHLLAHGKKPLQALCAVMRKLLHAIHGMLRNNQPFDNTRFYATAA